MGSNSIPETDSRTPRLGAQRAQKCAFQDRVRLKNKVRRGFRHMHGRDQLALSLALSLSLLQSSSCPFLNLNVRVKTLENDVNRSDKKRLKYISHQGLVYLVWVIPMCKLRSVSMWRVNLIRALTSRSRATFVDLCVVSWLLCHDAFSCNLVLSQLKRHRSEISHICRVLCGFLPA